MSRKDPSRKYHNRVAHQYDHIYDDVYWEFHDEITWRSIKPHLPRNTASPCIDLGCGTGKWGAKLLKTGFPTTFLDHAPGMIDQVKLKVDSLGPKAKHATLLVADIIDLSMLPADHFELVLAMGDPLSICSNPARAVREMYRIVRPGGTVIATADNKLGALDYFAQRGNLDELEQFVRTGRTHWLTSNKEEQFELTTFTPASLRNLFEREGFQVQDMMGKTILPIRKNERLFEGPNAMDRLLRLEHEMSKDASSTAAASHLQIVAKKS
jgi:ubiquinone/menaquinone biosynthesis C-methylase UbiE